MKYIYYTLFFFLLPFSIFSQDTQKLLIIGIDGCRPDALTFAQTPAIDQLISNGIYSPDALNDDITISGPGWSAILCGVWSDKHGVFDNSFTNNNYANYPSIFKYLEAHNPAFHTASFCHWNPINDFIVGTDADFKLNLSEDAEVASQAAAYLSVNDPDMLFLHFDDVDHAGHGFGYSVGVPEYISAIEGVDTYIAQVLNAIESRSTYAAEDWLILVTTDHGGIGRGHGGNSLDERNVFVIASGKNISPEVINKDSTIIGGPENCLRDTVELEFNGNGSFVHIPTDSLFDFGADQDFTVECRVRTAIASDVAIVGNKDWNTGFNKGFVFSFKFASGPEWKVNIGDGNNRADINTGGSIADNEWHTLSVSFDRDGEMKMYEDGVLIATEDISNIGDIDTGAGLYFGSDINGLFNYAGAIAEVRVWDTIVDSTEIADWHCQRIVSAHPNYQNLTGYWQMNDGSGATQVLDASLNNNPGTITNAQWVQPDSSIIYDYSGTPRLVDLAVTALTHLCIPIQSSWDLDGETLISECMLTGISPDLTLNESVEVFPNPTEGTLRILLQNEFSLIKIELYRPDGKLLQKKEFIKSEATMNLTDLDQGVYFLKIQIGEKILVKRVVKI